MPGALRFVSLLPGRQFVWIPEKFRPFIIEQKFFVGIDDLGLSIEIQAFVLSAVSGVHMAVDEVAGLVLIHQSTEAGKTLVGQILSVV